MKPKISILTLTSFFFTSAIQILLLIITESVCEVVPKIQLVKWMGAGGARLFDISEVENNDGIISLDGNVYTVNSDAVALIFHCKAPYPVQWDFLQAKYMHPRENLLTTISIRTMRVTKENLNSSSEYITQLLLLGDNRIFNGNYICQKTSQKEIQSSFYLFWEGIADQSLVLYGRNFTRSSKSQEPITMPCHVTRPDIDMSLFKLEKRPANNTENGVEEVWQPVALNDSIKFDPTKGFTLNTAELVGINGKYKCVPESEGDFVIVDITDQEIQEVSVNEEIRSNATFVYEAKSEQENIFTCCSSSSRAPELSLYYCGNPVSCRLIREAVGFLESKWGITTLFQRLMKVRKFVNGSCVSFPRFNGGFKKYAVMARCVGDGINIMREMFFPLVGKTPQPYMNWLQAKPEDLIRLWPIEIEEGMFRNNTLKLFVGQAVPFFCKASPYYYSIGLRLVIRWHDGNQTVTPDGLIGLYVNDHFLGETNDISTEVGVELGMSSISCLAPVWNSTQWVSKSIQFNVSIPTLEMVGNSVEEHVYWTINDTNLNLKCQLRGTPPPTIIWTKNDWNILELNATEEIVKDQVTSTLHFPIVNHETHGEYKCRGENYAGSFTKSFKVFVENKKPWGIILIISFVLLWLFGGTIYFARRMKFQNSRLQTLQSQNSRNSSH